MLRFTTLRDLAAPDELATMMTPTRPNILLILIDDLGWRDLSCYGSSFYETPNLDLLAADGMRFTDAYASCPVCSPTRASIMTGKYPATVGITNWIYGFVDGKLKAQEFLDHLPLSETSVATALREGGYATWHVGKWHMGGEGFEPQDHGFDVNIGGGHIGSPRRGYFSPYQLPHLTDGTDGEYLTDRLTDESIRLIRERDREKPFFLNLSHYAVHIPLGAPEPLVKKYREKAAALGLDKVQAIQTGEFSPVLDLALKGQRVERRVIQSDPVYAAMIENLDWNIGRLLETLEEEGIDGDTLVVFTSDNGGLATAQGSPTCNLPLIEGKGWMQEGGTRVSQIARWTGRIPAGATCAVPVTSTDFYPTFLEAAGLPLRPQQHCDGVSLLPLLLGQGTGSLDREAIYWHYPHYSDQGGTPGASVRSGQWKLIHFFETDQFALYDLAADLGERVNLIGDRPDLVARLKLMLADWMAAVGAKIPEPNPDYERFYQKIRAKGWDRATV
jgi:arylsulfatase A-like enzyme